MGKKLKIWLICIVIALLGWFSGNYVLPVALAVSVPAVAALLVVAYALGTLFFIIVLSAVLKL